MQKCTEHNQKHIEKKINKKAIKWINDCSKLLIPLNVINAFLRAIEPYILIFIIEAILLWKNNTIIVITFGLLFLGVLNIFGKILKYKIDIAINLLRIKYNLEISNKRIELSNMIEYNNDIKLLSSKLEDYQQYNGGPIKHKYTLIEKKILKFLGFLVAFIIYKVYIRNIVIDLLLLVFVVISYLVSFIFNERNKKIEKKHELVQEKIMENNRLGGFYFSLLSSEFESMKSIRNNSTNGFIEKKYADFMDPMIVSYETYSKSKFNNEIFRKSFNLIVSLILVLFILKTNIAAINLASIFAIINIVAFASDVNINRQEESVNTKRMSDFFKFINLYNKQKMMDFHNDENIIVELKDVSYKYANQKEYTLSNVNLRFEKNKVYTIVGHNGSGKSTLIKIIVGIITDIDKGKITYNENMGNCTIPYCPQISPVFSFSIGENISLDEKFDDGLIKNILDKLKFNLNLDDISNVKLGHDFKEMGISLSGGQEKKLSVARALYYNKDIIILDEPTSSLDIFSEQELYSVVNDNTKDRACIFVSHRLTSSKFSDEIIILNNGMVVGKGKHSELLKNNIYYQELFNAQAKHYRKSI
ncbi:MAG: ATP-binding cassette domain-containing protein [Anaerorhabdus sp.]